MNIDSTKLKNNCVEFIRERKEYSIDEDILEELEIILPKIINSQYYNDENKLFSFLINKLRGNKNLVNVIIHFINETNGFYK
jgi:hypothetical protein